MPDSPQPRLEGGLWCTEVLEYLDAYVGGTLEPEAKRMAEAHLAVCDRCAAFGGAYASLVRELHATLSAPPPLDPDRKARLTDRLTRALESK